MARGSPKGLQGGITSIGYTMVGQCLNSVIMFSGNDGVEFGDSMLEKSMLSTNSTDAGNPRAWFRGTNYTRGRLIK